MRLKPGGPPPTASDRKEPRMIRAKPLLENGKRPIVISLRLIKAACVFAQYPKLIERLYHLHGIGAEDPLRVCEGPVEERCGLTIFAPDAMDRAQATPRTQAHLLDIRVAVVYDLLHYPDRELIHLLGCSVLTSIFIDHRQVDEDLGDIRVVRPFVFLEQVERATKQRLGLLVPALRVAGDGRVIKMARGFHRFSIKRRVNGRNPNGRNHGSDSLLLRIDPDDEEPAELPAFHHSP